MSSMYRTRPIRPISVRPNICQIVPTTFQGISSESATMTSTADDFQPVDGMDRASSTPNGIPIARNRSEEHTSELQSLMRISYAVLCLTKKKQLITKTTITDTDTNTTSLWYYS